MKGIMRMKFGHGVLASFLALGLSATAQVPGGADTKPMPLSQPRPGAAAVEAWRARRFAMFIHFGLYSELGGVWQGKRVTQGYSEQIMANAGIPKDVYAGVAKEFDPEHFDPDAIVALAKAAGMRSIVLTAKHHDGFAMFATKQSPFNIVDATPYHRDVVKEMADACARGGLKFGVYYSTIDWHAPTGSPYLEGNSNPISNEHAASNVAQLKELLTGYGPISEVWFDMGRPTPDQSRLFAQTVHRLQPDTMVSGRVFHYEGDFAVMGDNEVPAFAIDEPWQTPASIFGETWGYRSWQERGDLTEKVHEKLLELVAVVSRGGNYILNIGPEGDGSVVPFEASVLKGMGAWLEANGEAVFGDGTTALAASPFRALDFGFATTSENRLYLFLKRIPKSGHLELPGVEEDAGLGTPYLLRYPHEAAGQLRRTPSGVTIELNAQARGRLNEFLPVIAIPLTTSLHVRPVNLVVPEKDGTLVLPANSADKFLNYNGNGYEDSSSVYKLRWHIAPGAGLRRVEVVYDEATSRRELSLISGTHVRSVVTKKGSAEAVWQGSMQFAAGDQELEATPKLPFYKGTPLPVTIREIRLLPTK